MSKAVIFRTPGKLDLRSLTIFGLNSKPNATNPIGYFGTGLKYAIAVLTRERIAVTFWIGDQKWSIEPKDTKFRDKSFASIVLIRHRKFMPPKEIVLPFTTELGKNWGLWQAFRELHSNTIDENGSTKVLGSNFVPAGDAKPYTYIIVEGDKFVDEYLQREKTFLKDAFREQTDARLSVQTFPEKSMHIYYRGIRVKDLPKPSEVTYNILQRIELTEDRTVANDYQVDWLLERHIVKSAPLEVVKRVISAPPTSYEGSRFQYDYCNTPPSKTFEEAMQEEDNPSPHVKTYHKRFQPPEPEVTLEPWIDDLIAAIGGGDWSFTSDCINQHRLRVIDILTKAIRLHEPSTQKEPENVTVATYDDIPF